MTSIGFIGGGKMAEAIIARSKRPSSWLVHDLDAGRRAYLRRRYKVKLARSNLEVFRRARVIILAVKPQNFPALLAELGTGIRETNKGKVVISIAAGVTTKYLRGKLPGCQVVRVMPNNPALVGAGITAIARRPRVTRYALRITRDIFAGIGQVVEVKESLMDAVTGLSGSGPAYVYLMIEALTGAGAKLGLSARVAEKLAVETVLGAAKTMQRSGKSAQELREMVTSPGGTTEAGLKVLAAKKFKGTVAAAVKAAAEKSRRLSEAEPRR